MLRYLGLTPKKEKPLFPVHSLVQVARRASLAHRSRMDIIANILNAANRGARKTHIMYSCNLSFRQLHVYLAFLKDRRLLKVVPIRTEEKSNSLAYETTRKGRAFLQAYGSIRALLSTSEFED
jgi:predicted transcriptional regulator